MANQRTYMSPEIAPKLNALSQTWQEFEQQLAQQLQKLDAGFDGVWEGQSRKGFVNSLMEVLKAFNTFEQNNLEPLRQRVQEFERQLLAKQQELGSQTANIQS